YGGGTPLGKSRQRRQPAVGFVEQIQPCFRDDAICGHHATRCAPTLYPSYRERAVDAQFYGFFPLLVTPLSGVVKSRRSLTICGTRLSNHARDGSLSKARSSSLPVW